MKKFLYTCCLFLGGLLGAQAQTLPASDTLYQALGQKAGITALMDEFVGRVLQDVRIKHHFKDTNAQTLKAQPERPVLPTQRRPLQIRGCGHEVRACRHGHPQA